MSCERTPEIIGVGTVESVDTREPTGPVGGVIESLLSTIRPVLPSRNVSLNTTVSTTVSTASSTIIEYSSTEPPTTLQSTTLASTNRPTSGRTGSVYITRTTVMPPKYNQDLVSSTLHQPRPPLVLGSPIHKTKSSEKDIIVEKVYRQDNSVIIHWGTESSNILGFRVIYRLFGDSTFKQAPPLEASEREFKIKNVPSQVSYISCMFLTISWTL